MKVQISAGALIFAALMLLLLPLKWVAAAFLAAAVHELFHLGAVYLTGGRISGICIGSRGAVMSPNELRPLQEFLCTIAGPVGSFSLLLFARWMPRVAICGLLHGIYNLLPLLPLDGGRILDCLLRTILSPPLAARVFYRIQWVVFGILGLLLVVAVARLGMIILIPVFFLLPRVLFGGTIGVLSKKRYGYDRFTETNSPNSAETGTIHGRRI